MNRSNGGCKLTTTPFPYGDQMECSVFLQDKVEKISLNDVSASSKEFREIPQTVHNVVPMRRNYIICKVSTDSSCFGFGLCSGISDAHDMSQFSGVSTRVYQISGLLLHFQDMYMYM